MTEQQRQEIRAELARRMGYTNFREVTLYSLAGPVNELICDPPLGVEPNTRFFECSVTGRAAFSASVPPDPFTNAEDKDALVEWLAAQDEDTQELYQQHLVRKLSWDDSHNRSALVEALVFQTAPYEAITLAAAKALGIGEVE